VPKADIGPHPSRRATVESPSDELIFVRCCFGDGKSLMRKANAIAVPTDVSAQNKPIPAYAYLPLGIGLLNDVGWEKMK
jgi:hypothetical protein